MYSINIHVIFSSLFSVSYFKLYGTLLFPFVCQALLLYLFLFSQCCYNLYSGTVFIWFPILWLQSLLFLPHLILVFYYVYLCVTSTFSRISLSLFYFIVHSYLPLSVRFYCSIYFSSVSVVTIYIPVLFLFDFPYCDCNHYSLYHISFLSSTMYTSSYINIHQCYIIQYFFFVFYFPWCLNSHLFLYSFFCDNFLIISRVGYR